jgi:cytidine deaminase
MLKQFLAYTQKTWQLDLNHVSQLSRSQLDELCTSFSIDKATCLFTLLPLAANYALVPLSQYRVGAIAVGLSGDAYFGANMEFGGHSLSQTVHAEQAAINHAWQSGEQGISDIFVNQSPCGHCRQFMNELSTSEQLNIHVQDRASMSLAQLLPDAFGPKDLGIIHRLMSPPAGSILPQGIVEKSLETVWQRSYSPYSESPSMCAISLQGGERFYGCYAENAAFNPSLPPLQSALIMVRLAGQSFDRILDVELFELKDAPVQHYDVTLSLIKAISPAISLRYNELTPV